VVKHPFHLVSPSPWPLLVGIASFLLTYGATLYFCLSIFRYLLVASILLFVLLMFWFLNICWESVYLGCHSLVVQQGLRLGFILFILSEVALFFRLFWAYAHSSLSPAIELGSCWPPTGISAVHPFSLPLVNTFVLLTSSATLTCSHLQLITWDLRSCFLSFVLTLCLGAYFLCLQGIEYSHSTFTIADSAFGSTFFLLTGFHGFHVLLGTIFLRVMFFRLLALHFTSSRHLGFVFSIWYWHFVDVVWLFVYLIVYCWGCYCKDKLIQATGFIPQQWYIPPSFCVGPNV